MFIHPFKGDWNAFTGQVKEAFDKVTDDDIVMAEGNADHLVGAIQKRYGYTRDQADQAWLAFTTRLSIAVMNADDHVDASADVIEPPTDGDAPYDPDHPLLTPAEARIRDEAQIDVRELRREF